MSDAPDYRNIHHGDEVVIGPLKGVRFWGYSLRDMKITSFQWYHEWSPDHPTVDNEDLPTMENGRGLNVYRSVADAMRGSADAVNDIIERPDRWVNSDCGIVLGEVEFWGVVVEHQFGYAAQIVRPVRFLRAWGAHDDWIVDELNSIWFGERDE